jgi:DNA invertase Pin-like site-specific DNA recombinase
MSTLILGYARVSTADQDPALQIGALREAGCDRVITERASGARGPAGAGAGLRAAARWGHAGGLAPGPPRPLPVGLDRAGQRPRRSRRRAAEIHEHIGTTTEAGPLISHVFAALAESERGVVRERTNAGLGAARARGRRGGRRPVMTPAKLGIAQQMYDSGEHTVAPIAGALGASRATICRSIKLSADDLAAAGEAAA